MFEHGDDVWSSWLLDARFAGDSVQAARIHQSVSLYADKVLEGAALAPGMTMADLGSGEGIIAWRAIERIGPDLQVILTDVSAPMLAHARRTAATLGLSRQCRFLEARADRLDDIQDSSLDVITTRSSLAYVADKPAVFAEMFRVLKPGGRVSLGEPLFRDEALSACAMRMVLARRPPGHPPNLLNLMHRLKAAQFPDTEAAIEASPITCYSERDLLRFAQQAGFRQLHLELHIDTDQPPVKDWRIFLGMSPHPWAPPLRKILDETFSAEERRLFEVSLRPQVEGGRISNSSTMVYLSGSKPA